MKERHEAFRQSSQNEALCVLFGSVRGPAVSSCSSTHSQPTVTRSAAAKVESNREARGGELKTQPANLEKKYR